jgi:hypothetical protein
MGVCRLRDLAVPSRMRDVQLHRWLEVTVRMAEEVGILLPQVVGQWHE